MLTVPSGEFSFHSLFSYGETLAISNYRLMIDVDRENRSPTSLKLKKKIKKKLNVKENSSFFLNNEPLTEINDQIIILSLFSSFFNSSSGM